MPHASDPAPRPVTSEDESPDSGVVALLLACPAHDIAAAAQVQASRGIAVIPAGAVGDLDHCGMLTDLYLLEIRDDGIAPAATWSAKLLSSMTLFDPDPAELLPSTWTERHPHAYSMARHRTERQQVFLPVADLTPLPKAEWLFTNELVSKRVRGGRRFAPRSPTIVTLPD